MQAALKMAAARQTSRKLLIEKPQMPVEDLTESGIGFFFTVLLAASCLISIAAFCLVLISFF